MVATTEQQRKIRGIRTRRALATICAGVAFACPATAALADGGPIMPLSQVQAGMFCTGKTVIQGTTISSFDVTVSGTVVQPGAGARILVTVSGPAVEPAGVAEGFSGSPVYCPLADGTQELIGAISESVGDYGNDVALVTPIQQMLDEPLKPPSSAPRLTARTRSLAGPLTVSGLSPGLMSVIDRAAQIAGRQIVESPVSAAVPDFPVQDLVPGASVATAYSSGTIAMGAVGTVTYRDGNTVYAFGHELDGAGRRSLLLQDAYVYDVINNPDPTNPSFKLASPGHTVGTLTSDTPNAVLGVVGATPTVIPVVATAKDPAGHHTIVERTDVADETDVGFPLGGSLLDMIAPLAIGQAATDVFNGPPANESGRMCLTVALRGQHLLLRLCDRYVGTGAAGDSGENGPPEVANGAATDVSSALSLLDNEQFATLHVTSVKANIEAQPGLAEAAIVSAHAPLTVRPGQLVRVRLGIRLYRSRLRTVTFPLRIPPSARGFIAADVKGPPAPTSGASAQGSASLTVSLADLLGGPSTGGAGPTSMPALRSAFADVPTYDGLAVKIEHQPSVHVYRDPRLLITGSAPLIFSVKKASRRSGR